MLPADDRRVVRTMQAVSEQLSIKTSVGGIARYMNDTYFQQSNDLERFPCNPWIICTLWVANFQIATAKTLSDLAEPRRTLEKAASLPEQVHPETGGPLSVAPLTWSHATFAATVCKYVQKLEQLSQSPM